VTLVDVLRFLNLCMSGVVAGGMVVVAIAILPARRQLPTASAVVLHQVTTRNIDRLMPLSTVLSGVTAVLLIGALSGGSGGARTSLVVGAAATAAIVLLSVGLNMPVNRRVARWSPEAPPADHEAVLTRWNGVHRARSVLAVVALAAYVIAAIAE